MTFRAQPRFSQAVCLGVLAACCCLSGTVRADSYQGTGRVTLYPSLRLAKQDPFYASAANQGFGRAGGISAGPGVMGSFAYAASDNLEVAIDPFVATERLSLVGQSPIDVYVYGVTLGLNLLFPIQETWYPFLGLHTGPVLVYGGSGSLPYRESLGQTIAVSLGTTWRWSDQWGMSFRYLFAYGGQLSTPFGNILGRGHWLSVGITYYFGREANSRGFNP